jgi:hypothetical protein
MRSQSLKKQARALQMTSRSVDTRACALSCKLAMKLSA